MEKKERKGLKGVRSQFPLHRVWFLPLAKKVDSTGPSMEGGWEAIEDVGIGSMNISLK